MSNSGAPHHLIFEGADLVGKTSVVHRVWEVIEAKYRKKGSGLMDGCYWFHTDNCIYGSEYGKPVIEKYVDIAEILEKRNVIFERFHISDMVRSKLNRDQKIDYIDLEERLRKLNYKIICLKVDDNIDLFKDRIEDRLRQYPNQKGILESPSWYIEQQGMVLDIVENSSLESLVVDSTILPGEAHVQILDWLGEKE